MAELDDCKLVGGYCTLLSFMGKSCGIEVVIFLIAWDFYLLLNFLSMPSSCKSYKSLVQEQEGEQ